MSYNIHLYPKEVEIKEKASNDETFFDYEENLIPFTEAQKEYLSNRLLKYGYSKKTEKPKDVTLFTLDEKESIKVLLSKYALYFSASNFDDIFDISMTTSEFTDTGEFSKYDPQNGGWEEI